MVLLRPDPEKVVGRYLLFALQSRFVQQQIGMHEGTGSTVSNLRIPALEALRIPYYDLPEQRRIAAVLGALDDKIELNRTMNETLEAMAQAIFRSWFIDFDGVQPGDLVDSELGPIPKGWEVKPLRDHLAIIETGNRPRGGVAKFTSGVPSVGAESIQGGVGQFDFGKTKYIPEEFFTALKRGVVQNRDVLVYKDGGRPGEFHPHVSMFGDGFPFERLAINSHVYRLRTTGYLSQEYLYFWLSSGPMMAEMTRLGTGAAIPGIPRRSLIAMPLLVPPADLQHRFNKFRPSVGRILAKSNESRTLTALRDTLLPKLISGEVRVPEAEARVEAVG
jgi:type I restriction enzyme S subunit